MGGRTMKLEELKKTILDLDDSDQKQLLLDILPEMLPKVCTDDTCLSMIRNFIDKESSRSYQEQHMGGI